MNKKLFISKRIKGFSGRLDYYLIESRYDDIKNGVSTYVYGVEVQKITNDSYNVEYIQKREIVDISQNKDKVFEFLTLIAEGDVMPVTLHDVAEDFLLDGFFDQPDKNRMSA